jgi:hypothetical protein
VNRTKQQEKKSITDFLENLEKDELRIEDMLKKFKMGRWNIGMQKGVFQYDKATYEREREGNLARMYNDLEINDLENYEQVKNAAKFGSLLCRIDKSQSCGNIMPQSGPMPECIIDMFNRWAKPTEPAMKQKTEEVQVLHILKKHNQSRRPSSWRCPVVTQSIDEATIQITDIRNKLILIRNEQGTIV